MTAGVGVLSWSAELAEAGGTVVDSSLEELYARFGPLVHRRCLALLGSPEEAEDALQDVFVRLTERRHQFRGEADLLTWIYRITTNLCLNRLRYLGHRRPPLGARAAEPTTNPQGALEGRLTVARLFEALEPLDVQIAVFCYFDGMTQSEIAEVVGLSDRSVRTHLRHIETVARALVGPIGTWGRSVP